MRPLRVLALLCALIALGIGVLTVAGRVLLVSDPLPRTADAIVVMAGSIPDRALEAAALYQAGVAPLVVVSRERQRGATHQLRAHGVRLPESDEITMDVLRQLGVPRGAILRLRRRGRSTVSEARTIARWACSRHYRSLVVVTSRAHTRRARLILHQSLGPAVQVAVRPSRDDTFPPWRWWRVRHHAKAVLREYEKLAHYWLREYWQIQPCGGLRRRVPSA